MSKRLFTSLLIVLVICGCSSVLAYNSDELNKRLISCTPTKDFDAGSTLYQISGLTGSVCIFKILNNGFGNKPDLICKVPYSRMREMTSYNPLTVQNLKNRYCVMSMKSLNKQKKIYY